MNLFEDLNWIRVQLTILSTIYIAVLIMILCDLISGVRKAKKLGEARTSYGFSRTIDKVVSRYLMLFCLTAVDCCAVWLWFSIGFPIFPYFTIMGGVGAGLIEIKSIFEKAEDKERKKIKEAGELAALIISKLNDDKVKDIIEMLKK